MAIEEIAIATVNPIFFSDIILCSSDNGNRRWLFGLVVDTREEAIALALLGGIILFVYGLIPTLQPAHFGRVYAAYGGIFVLSSILWGMIVDKKRPDRYELIGSFVAFFGAIIIFYSPR